MTVSDSFNIVSILTIPRRFDLKLTVVKKKICTYMTRPTEHKKTNLYYKTYISSFCSYKYLNLE